MEQFTKFVGMDVHKATIAVSVAERGGEIRYLAVCRTQPFEPSGDCLVGRRASQF
jgi:transposase